MSTLGDMVVTIGGNIQGFKDAMGEVMGALDSFSSQAASIGSSLSVLTAPIALIGGSATAAALDFESAMKTIRAGTGETGDSLTALGDTFSRVFGAIPASAHDAAEAITIVFQRMTDENGARLAGAQLEAFSTQILNLARITHSDLQPLAETVTRAFKDWGFSAEESAKSLDFLFKAAQQNGVAITKMTENLVNFGAPLRGLGFDFETAATMIARFEKEGVPLTTALAAMRFAIGNFAKGGLDAKEALAATIDAIKNAATSADQMSIGLTTVGKRGMTDFVDAVKMGRFDLDEMTDSLKKNTETINGTAAATLKFSEEWQLLKNNMEIALKPIGDTLLKSLEGSMNSGFLKDLIDDVHSLADSFAALDPSTQAFIVGLAGIAVAAGPILVTFGAVAASVAALGGAAVVAGGAIAVLAAAFAAFQIGGVVEEAAKFVSVLDSWYQSTTMAKDAVKALCDEAAGDAGKVGILGQAFLTMKSDVESWFGALASLPWAQALNPLAALKQSFADVTLEIQHSMGIYPEFAGAVNRMTSAVAGFMSAQAAAVPGGMGIAAAVDKIKDSTTQAAIQFKLAKGAWEQLKAEQSTGAATSDQVTQALLRLRTAAAAAGVDISKLVGDQKAAKEAAKQEADALADVKAAMDVLNEDRGDRKVTADIDKLYASLRSLFKAYQDGRISLQDYETETGNMSDRLREMDRASTDAADSMSRKLQESYGKALTYLHSINGAAEEITNSIWDQMKSGLANGFNSYAQEVAKRIQQVAIDLKDVGNIFQSIGGTQAQAEESIAQIDANLNRVRELYFNLAKDLKGNAIISQADMQREEIAAGEQRIAIARKVGKDVTDAQIQTLEAQKVAFTKAHMDIEQAYKDLGVTTTRQYEDQVQVATSAYEKIKNSALSSHQDILKGEAALFADQLAAQQANGDAISESQKRQLAKMQQIAHEGIQTIQKEWDAFANHIGDAVSKGLDSLANDVLTGKFKGIKEMFTILWTDIAASFTKDFIHPITAALGVFLAKGLTGLVSGNGFAGFNLSTITDAFKIGKSVAGLGSSAADITSVGFGAGSAAVTAASSSALDGLNAAATGASSAIKLSTTATQTATSATSATASASGGLMKSLGGLAGAANIANAAIGAISGIVSGVQQAHANSLLDKIEKSTRELSVVTWQNGANSVLGMLEVIRNTLYQVNDRLIDVRSALFDPVAKDLEDIYKLLQSGVSVAEAAATSTTTATEQVAEQVTSVAAATEALSTAMDTATQFAAVTADGVAGLQSISADTASATSNLAGTVTQSGNEVINAIGQTGAEAIAAAASNTDAMLERLSALGSDIDTITGNAYSDLKAQIKGVGSQSLADQAAAVAKAQAEAAAAARIGMSPLEIAGLTNPTGSFLGRQFDNSNLYSGAAGYSLNNLLAPIAAPVSIPLGAAGFSTTQNYGYVAPDPRNSAPGAPGTAGLSRTPTAPVQYASQGNVQITQQFYGPVTGEQYSRQLMKDGAEQITIALR